MNKKLALTKVASALLMTLSVSGCIRFEERAQAEGSFDYQDTILLDEQYNSGDFTRHEQRENYDIPALTEAQLKLGLIGEDVDIRPPNQLMSVIDGVVSDPDVAQAKIWFNAFTQDPQLEQKVWDLVVKYLDAKGATQRVENRNKRFIETGPVIRQQTYGSYFNENDVHDEGDYHITLSKAENGRRISLLVDVQTYRQTNDDKPVNHVLEGRMKKGVEVRFINDLLRFIHTQQESDALEAADNQPLPIKLGFDDNHQTAWVIDMGFLDVWRKLPELLSTMSFEPVQDDKNLGYFLVKFVPQNEDYWTENHLNAIDLQAGEYFVQLGELTGGATSIIWLDADKKLLSDQEITDLYLSITENIRSVTLNESYSNL